MVVIQVLTLIFALAWAFDVMLIAVAIAWRLTRGRWPRWTRARKQPIPEPAREPSTAETAWAKPSAVVHLIVHPEDRPICGASIRQPWTEDPAAATCPECKFLGNATSLQWKVSTR